MRDAGKQADLPAPDDEPGGDTRFAIAYKGTVTRAGHWRVPQRIICAVYKGAGYLDLSAARLTAPATTIVAIAYKSQVRVVLPPGLRVEASGMGVSCHAQPGGEAAPGTPVLRVSGVACKGGIDVRVSAPAVTA